MMIKRPILKTRAAEVEKMLTQGCNARIIAERLGYGVATVQEFVKLNFPQYQRPRTELAPHREHIIRRAREGATTSAIAGEIGASDQSVRAWMARNGLHSARRRDVTQ